MASATTRPDIPRNTLVALGLLVGGPVTAHLLVHALTPPAACGAWGLDCTFRTLIGSLLAWLAGSGLAVRGVALGERRWLAVAALVLNLLPLAAFAVLALAIATRS